jgi:hypothetical protein
MNDTPTFSPFATTQPAPMFDGETAPKRGRRKGTKPGRKPRHDIAEQVRVLGADSLLPPGHTKVPTKRKTRVARPVKFELDMLMAFQGLKADDFKLTMQLVQALQGVNKKSRAKIVAALAKVFA